jgi:K+-sensing histidine kinase KdpD
LLRNAYDENERLYELVENLLLSAKLEGHYKPFPEEFNLVNLVEELIAKQKVKHPEVDFKFQVSEAFPLVNMDKPGLWSVINNLLENAVKYRNGDPKIEIRLFEKAQMVNLEVADCGPGIPVSERKRIFEKFYRIGSEETRKSKGTGLGLFIVDNIVKAHKGKIQVSDNKPRGTVFSISIPV